MKKLFVLACLALLALPADAANRKPIVVGSTGQQQQIQSTDTLATPAPTTANASINLPHGTAPSSPADGDCWTTTLGLYCRVNGATVGPMNADSAITFKDEGSTLTSSTTSVDCVGAGVTCTNSSGAVTLTVASAGGSSDYVWLATQSLNGLSSYTFTISSLVGANTFRDLHVVLRGRSGVSGTLDDVLVRFNGDTGNNYCFMLWDTVGTTTGVPGQATATSALRMGTIPGNTAQAGAGGVAELTIYDYQSSFFKNAKGSSFAPFNTGSGQSFGRIQYNCWRSTSAITTVQVFSSVNFINGSTLSIYGIK